ncbi:HNH endonuclease signature motif containing protein [Aminobacter sp. UC22_36]|uniref:HNH endonuclease signature motif containing protein n=1 Tax=Aminobacter sp. UC22_36 TaxID=3374549 RepID=UPI00375691C5
MAGTKHTAGPWAWFGNANSNHVYLATVHGGRRYVMDFTRWGMRGAQPRFQPERGGMVDAKDLLQFEVGDQNIVGVDAARKDTSVYRYDVRGINCADARLIAAAPDLLGELKRMVEHFSAWSSTSARGPTIIPTRRQPKRGQRCTAPATSSRKRRAPPMHRAQKRLREMFAFDEEAGHLIWRERPSDHFATAAAGKIWNSRYAGTVAGVIGAKGYRRIKFAGKTWSAHRLIWIYINGQIPDGLQVDHINGNRSDNCLDNLRLVTNAENSRNQSMPRNNTSGVMGVVWHRRARKWQAQVKITGQTKYLGLFDTIEAASSACAKAEIAFGFHPSHGKRPAAKLDGRSHA